MTALIIIGYIIIGILIAYFIYSFAEEAYGDVFANFMATWAMVLSPILWPIMPVVILAGWLTKFVVQGIGRTGRYLGRELNNPRENV